MSTENPRVPLPLKPFHHVLPVQVRFNDVDMFGHINNSVYFEYFDIGKLNYFEKVLGPDFAKKGFTAVIVNVNCDFFSPAFINEELRVFTAVVHLGEKSITLEQRIVNEKNEDVKCICRTVMSGFDPVTLKSAPIPDFFRNLIQAFEKI